MYVNFRLQLYVSIRVVCSALSEGKMRQGECCSIKFKEHVEKCGAIVGLIPPAAIANRCAAASAPYCSTAAAETPLPPPLFVSLSRGWIDGVRQGTERSEDKRPKNEFNC